METAFAQIAAEALGVPFADVEVVHGDTSLTPRGSGTRASRSLVVGGTAIVKACERVTAKAVQIAGALLHVDPQSVTLAEGKFCVEASPDRHVTWTEVSREAYDPRHLPSDLERGLEATAYWEPLAYTSPCSASVAVVELDTDTGAVTLTKYIYVDDCGTVVNPLIVEGQVHGGLAQGIGAALLEEAVWDDRGQLVTGKQNPQSARRNNFPGEQISRRFLLLSENLSASNYPGAAREFHGLRPALGGGVAAVHPGQGGDPKSP
jgi:aerobic carbon-monoxide dehydrogenase large subunit